MTPKYCPVCDKETEDYNSLKDHPRCKKCRAYLLDGKPYVVSRSTITAKVIVAKHQDVVDILDDEWQELYLDILEYT